MNFKDFKAAIQRQFNVMKAHDLFRTEASKDDMWTEYLASFKPEFNPIFRERTEHDCNCCKQFIRAVGNMVAIIDNKIVSIWDVTVGGSDNEGYQDVANAMSKFVKAHKIENIFLHYEKTAGTDKNNELKDGVVKTWEHFYIQLPDALVLPEDKIGTQLTETRGAKDVMLRGLNELTVDSLETILDLIDQSSLYRGDENRHLVEEFLKLKKQFIKLTKNRERNIFCWSRIRTIAENVAKFRDTAIGTLAVALSEGEELEGAVGAFEFKVSAGNYKRTTAVVTEKQKQEAIQDVKSAGLESALDRRPAVMEDVNINDVLFADRSIRKSMAGSTDAFSGVVTKGEAKPKNLDKVEEVSIEKFLSDILPKIDSLEVMFENKHTPNLVSLVAPADLTAKQLFKWKNLFSWSYVGEVADSIKERVKKAGGNVTGELCCRLAWNNSDDLDFHMEEATGYLIHYMNRSKKSPNGGILDIDANGADKMMVEPVENIYYESIRTMKPGTYGLYVHQYQVRSTSNVGFEADVDILGTIHHFSYPKAVKQGERIKVANVKVANGEATIIPVLESSQSSKQVWGISTQTFHKVHMAMLSPNYWGDRAVGNKHYFFMLENCINDGRMRGFYNEFLIEELNKHRKTMEIVGATMRMEESDRQLSGLGFSSTQRNELLCRVKGSFTRTIKIKF